MQNRQSVCVLSALALAAVACGEEAAALALHDAGRALQDAAQWLDDAGQADAQDAPEPPEGPETTMVECDQVRTITGKQDIPVVRTQHFARVEVSPERLRSLWVCSPAEEESACPADHTCTGASVPALECRFAADVREADGVLWVMCGETYNGETYKGFHEVRVIADR